MDAIRVVLIDPLDESRAALERLLGGLEAVWLAESCKTYAGAAKAVADQIPDLVVLDLDANHEAALALLGELARAHPGLSVLPASGDRGGELILRAMRAGAREFLTLPADPEELLSAIGRLVGRPAGGPSHRLGGRVVVVAGASGGVGCTTLAVNLAATLARDAGRSVALADFDLLIGAVDACLDIVPAYTLLEVAQSADRLDLPLLKRSMTRHGSGLYVLPRPVAMEDAARIDPEAMRRVAALLKAAFSLVVIDASKALHASDFVAFEMADEILLVAQLELANLRNTARLLQVFGQIDGLAEKVRLVVNRDGFRECQIKPRKAEETLKLPVSWSIPEAHREIAMARSRGVPLCEAYPRCAAQRAIESMAQALARDEASSQARDRPRLPRIAALF
jgi:pilus assembly protein CpaE